MAYGVTTVQNGMPCQMIRNTNWDLNVAETENFGITKLQIVLFENRKENY